MQIELDAALAVSLQIMEAQQTQQQQQLITISSAGGSRLAARLQASYGSVLQYESPHAQNKAREAIPLADLEEEAAVQLARHGVRFPRRDQLREALLRRLLVWFKSWFRWVDSPACPRCPGGSGARGRFCGVGAPTADDLRHGGHRVELHACTGCGHLSRFVRYNDAVKLLSTREGRCGEWANAFTLCCRAVGFEARKVEDWSDHVWTECYLEGQGRWVHLDPCEASYDTPLLYEQGWGKALSYVFAVGREGVSDVIMRYTRKWEEVKGRRREGSEEEVRRVCEAITERARMSFRAERREELRERDKEEEEQLKKGRGNPVPGLENLPGRQTGSEEWRRERGRWGGGQQTCLYKYQ